MPTPTRLVTVKELSRYLRVHPSTIYRLLKRGELPGFKLGSDRRFSLEAIDRWRERQGGELEENGPKRRS
jgi:excisionase family DNA binding protein